MLPRPTTTTNTEAGIGGGKDIENSVNPPLPSSNVGSEDVVGTSSGSSISDKKVEGEDPTTAHVSSPSQSPASLTPKDGENSGSPTVSTSSQSNTAPQLKIGGGGGFGSAVVGNAKSNAFSSLAGLNENGKWMGNIEGGTIPRGQELWGGLTQLTSSSELGNSSIYVEEKGNDSKNLFHSLIAIAFLFLLLYIHQVHLVLCGSYKKKKTNRLYASMVSTPFPFAAFMADCLQ